MNKEKALELVGALANAAMRYYEVSRSRPGSVARLRVKPEADREKDYARQLLEALGVDNQGITDEQLEKVLGIQ